MRIPDPNVIFPNEYKTSCFLKNVITTPNIHVGDYIRKIVKCDASGNIIKVTTYSVGNKFGKTMNEMTEMVEFSYQY